jgi:hypothetical protein
LGYGVAPQSGAVSVSGFEPNAGYVLEIWDTYETDPIRQVTATRTLHANAAGELRIDVQGLTKDIAVKIFRPAQAPVRAAPPSGVRRGGAGVGPAR